MRKATERFVSLKYTMLKYSIIAFVALCILVQYVTSGSNLVFYLAMIILAVYAVFILNSPIYSIQNELNSKTDELNALHNASGIISTSFDAQKNLQLIFDLFRRFTKCERAMIGFINKDTGKLQIKYDLGKFYGLAGREVWEGSVMKECFTKVKTVLKTDTLLAHKGTNGDKMAFPLFIKGELIGVLFIESIEPHSFSGVNIEFLESLANYAAIGLTNSEMFNDIYNQKQEIEALYEETAAVNEELHSYIKDLDYTRTELKNKNEELTRYFEEIQTGCLETVMVLANSIEANDPYTRGHCQRVMEISCELGRQLGLGEEDINDLIYATVLHDIGKLGISTQLLRKTSSLDESEYEEIKKHPIIAFNILNSVKFLKNSLDGILQHHERYDGKGYPNGLNGNEISLPAKILCIADAFDAMTSDRPYRKSMSMDEALKEIEDCAGTQFDPEVVAVFIKLSKGILQ